MPLLKVNYSVKQNKLSVKIFNRISKTQIKLKCYFLQQSSSPDSSGEAGTNTGLSTHKENSLRALENSIVQGGGGEAPLSLAEIGAISVSNKNLLVCLCNQWSKNY